MTIDAHTTSSNCFGHYFSNEDAIRFGGSDAAAIFAFMRYWLGINKKAGRNLREGRYWTYNSAKDLLKYFPYLSESTISRILKRLVEMGVLIRDNFNASKYDKTFWYSMPGFEAETPAQETVVETVNNAAKIASAASIRQNDEPIPTNNTIKNLSITTTSAVDNSTPVTAEQIESSRSDSAVVFHKAIPKEQRPEIQKHVAKIADISLQQAILDVLTAAILTGAIRTNPIAYVSGLVKRCKQGNFDSSTGYHIAKAREAQREELRKRQIEEAQQRQKQQYSTTPGQGLAEFLKAARAALV